MADVNEVEWLHRAERKEFISFLVFQDNEDIRGIPFGSLKPPPPPPSPPVVIFRVFSFRTPDNNSQIPCRII